MDTYTFLSNLAAEVEMPKDGILSRILLKNEAVNVTLFAFSAGQELSDHTAAMPAIVQILEGEAELTVNGERKTAGPGTWLYMPARMTHGLLAKTPLIMLLLLLKS